MGYIIRFRDPRPERGQKFSMIESWGVYMESLARLVTFAPDFTQWDEDSREMEALAVDAIAASKRVIKEHKRPGSQLPKEVVDSIYQRTDLLKNWMVLDLEQVRSRPDYKKWKAEQDAPPPTSQCMPRLEINRYYIVEC
jgi:hypothetical protein